MKNKEQNYGGWIKLGIGIAIIAIIAIVVLFSWSKITGNIVNNPASSYSEDILASIPSIGNPQVYSSASNLAYSDKKQEIKFYSGESVRIKRVVYFNNEDNFEGFILEEIVPEGYELCDSLNINHEAYIFYFNNKLSQIINEKMFERGINFDSENSFSIFIGINDSEMNKRIEYFGKTEEEVYREEFNWYNSGTQNKNSNVVMKFVISYDLCKTYNTGVKELNSTLYYFNDEIKRKQVPLIGLIPGIEAEIKTEYEAPVFLTSNTNGVVQVSIAGKYVDNYIWELEIDTPSNSYKYQGNKVNFNLNLVGIAEKEGCSKASMITFKLKNGMFSEITKKVNCLKIDSSIAKGKNIKVSFKPKFNAGFLGNKGYPASCSLGNSDCGIVSRETLGDEVPFFSVVGKNKIVYLPLGEYIVVRDSSAGRVENKVVIDKKEFKKGFVKNV
ncbi:hypothetical protein HYW76_01445 [Candidatus Pacearchaeota archaeon]|nr:hypothetical protein [Candidatus Pacearchaeota archaeon]